MCKRIQIIRIILTLLVVGILPFIFSENVMADGTSTIENKAFATSLIRCYNDGAFKETITVGDGAATDINSYDDAYKFTFDKTTGTGQYGGLNGTLDKAVYEKCLFFINDLAKRNGVDIKNITSDGLIDLGYEKHNDSGNSGSSNTRCMQAVFAGNYAFETDKICAQFDENDKITEIQIYRGEGADIIGFYDNNTSGLLEIRCSAVNNSGSSCNNVFYKRVDENKDDKITICDTWSDFKECVRNQLLGYGTDGRNQTTDQYGHKFYFSEIKELPLDDVNATYSLISGNETNKKATKYLLGEEFDSVPTFTPVEKFVMYQNYLKKYYRATISCDVAEDKEDQYEANGGKKIWFYDGNDVKTCYALNPENASDEINGFDDESHFALENCNYDCLTTWLAGDEAGGVTKEDLANYKLDTSLDPPSEEEEENICFANSGSLGWIICPIIEGISRVGTAAWEFIEKDFLQLRSAEMFASNGGMKVVWDNFRNIANTAFIILFMVVIFSQLTGVGIDNYGIKKIMPKLIIVAILVNLSFLLCELAVDLSNILGNGLNKMFTDWAGEIPQITGLETTSASAGSILAVIGLSAGGLALFGILNPVGGALTLGGVVLGVGLAVLGIVISIVFSILFLFIILIIRNAGVVILISVAPIAIVCYMLPNTEKIYKKWFEMLKALLVVYPICGAMIGAGKLAGNMLASIDSPGMAIAGMIVSVLPFFLIPTLLKQSLKMMGNVGALLTSAGRKGSHKLSSDIRGATTNSERFKDWSQYAQERKSGRRAERISNRLRRRATGADGELHLEQLSERNKHKLLKADTTRNSWTQKGAQADVGAYVVDPAVAESRAKASVRSQELKAYQDQYTNLTRATMGTELREAVAAYSGNRSAANTTRLLAAISAAESRGMNKEMLNEMGGLQLSASDENDADILNQLASSKDKVIGQYGRQMSKPTNTNENLSMNQFAASTGGVRLSDALADQGANALVGANDDTLEYLKNHGRSAVTSDMLVNAATNASNSKELNQINQMLKTTPVSEDINFSGDDLLRFDNSTVKALEEMRAAGNHSVGRSLVGAADSIAKSPEKAAMLKDDRKAYLNTTFMRPRGLSDIK